MPAPAAIFSVDVPCRPVRANSAMATTSTVSRRSSADMRRSGGAVMADNYASDHSQLCQAPSAQGILVDDQHRDRAVVEDVVADAAEDGRTDRPARASP